MRSFAYDPVLAHRPNFAKSLPVQVLLLGIVMTLVVVLIIHLAFTAQYHWPLAPVNYVLQMSAVITLLISCIATLHVVLSSTIDQSMTWPYMLDYVAVDMPPFSDTNDGWTMSELIAWLLMNATTSGLIQITHIQFLTLLFPSVLEKRLIFCLLGPLAIVSSIMQILRVTDGEQINKLAAAAQNICNATLSLLFTAALVLWGCVVNRGDAWRTDGGTAAFGIGALTLAFISTALTFLYIPSRDQYPWMPALTWAVILWQSFLGWWWWVGAGMGVGEIEELLRREEKRQTKRRLRLAKRNSRKERAQTLWKGVTGAFTRTHSDARAHASDTSGTDGDSSDGTTVDDVRPSRSHSTRSTGAEETASRMDESTRRAPSDQSDEGSASTSGGRVTRFLNQYRPGRFLYGWYLGLRHAHLAAAREQAVERVERINQAYGPEAAAAHENGAVVPTFGWGLGSFGVQRQRRREWEQREREEAAWKEYEMDEFSDTEEREELRDGPRQRRRTPQRAVGGLGAGLGAERRMDEDSHRPGSVWWWGPLQRWRLQDSTDYRS
ncbi:uncharacterized protein BXZ73DRAFT_89561 [Epithele typhae]|uniref:uncharacterized protein n=1 Tax=Epithele typhae TaxID=378194 RepID=UPI00200792C0|nr:uncharacterized protein BXZ73DRAFT_89561 [Epithele typhae]KAH9935234.1 hypothetical protein BXZ73DRAFT_89561 [Epithele typhae]